MKRPFIPKQYRPYVPGSKLQKQALGKCEFFNECLPSSILLISAKEDIIPDAFLKEIESADSIKRLYYDDLGVLWDFIYYEGVLKIFIPEGVLMPKSIYHRHPGAAQDHPYYHKHIAFFEVLDLWDGNLIGQKRDHHHNSSKIYQAITSIGEAKRKADANIRYPHSFFIKGEIDLTDHFKVDMIVKSCSNMRSRVVSQEEFREWDVKNLNNLPTLFQEKIDGKDVRVHVCKGNLWVVLINSKDCTDYRYASKGSVNYKNVKLPDEVATFCKTIAEIENNQLIGIDLIKAGEMFFCLESNPGPGWSTFNHPSKKGFAEQIFNELLV